VTKLQQTFSDSDHYQKVTLKMFMSAVTIMKVTDAIEAVGQESSYTKFVAREIFNQLDADGDGEITAVEFKRGLAKVNQGLSAKDVDDFFNLMDFNGDG
jgi:Ca2+-binding EF-hand superfamily protein